MATGMDLASEAEKLAQEALKKKKLEEDALLGSYSVNSGSLYDTAKSTSSDYLNGAKSDIQSLYDTGYSKLQDLTGQESAASMQDLVRQNENKLNSQGLLGGPSGALNEALAGASERVRVSQLSKLEDYINNKNSALASVYGNTASQQSALEQAYAGQKQGLLSTALQTKISNADQAAALTDKYTSAGLEAALGTNKITVETAAQKDLAAQQAQLAAEQLAAQQNATKSNLATRQQTWDSNFQSLKASLYRSYISAGYPDAQATANATNEATKQLGARPTV